MTEETKNQKTYYFVSGLPRSGSSLFQNVLNQNPRFYASATSGIIDIMFSIRNEWGELWSVYDQAPNPSKIDIVAKLMHDVCIQFNTGTEFRAMIDKEYFERAKTRVIKGIYNDCLSLDTEDSDTVLKKVLKGVLENYYAEQEAPIIFDKSRAWTHQIEMLETILEKKVKILVPVRDIRDVIASFEKIYRRMCSSLKQMPHEKTNYFQYQTVEGRSDALLGDSAPVGLAYNRIRDCIARGYENRLHYVIYEKFTKNPKKVMKEVYEFLGEEQFDHDFDNVKQTLWEDDLNVHGIDGLHDIQSKVTPSRPSWPDYLPEALADQLRTSNFWTK